MNPWRSRAGLPTWRGEFKRFPVLLGLTVLPAIGLLATTNRAPETVARSLTDTVPAALSAPKIQWEPLQPSESAATDLKRFLQTATPPRRPFSLADNGGLPQTTSSPTNAAMTLQENLERMEEERMERINRRIDENGYGISDGSRIRSRTIIDRGIEVVFVPEPVKIGRTQIGFSPYTAIKRRNPLCLLNPIPLTISW